MMGTLCPILIGYMRKWTQSDYLSACLSVHLSVHPSSLVTSIVLALKSKYYLKSKVVIILGHIDRVNTQMT